MSVWHTLCLSLCYEYCTRSQNKPAMSEVGLLCWYHLEIRVFNLQCWYQLGMALGAKQFCYFGTIWKLGFVICNVGTNQAWSWG